MFGGTASNQITQVEQISIMKQKQTYIKYQKEKLKNNSVCEKVRKKSGWIKSSNQITQYRYRK